MDREFLRTIIKKLIGFTKFSYKTELGYSIVDVQNLQLFI